MNNLTSFQCLEVKFDALATHLIDGPISFIFPHQRGFVGKHYGLQAKIIGLWAINTLFCGLAVAGKVYPLRVFGLITLIPAIRPLFYSLKAYVEVCKKLPLSQRIQCLAIAIFFVGLQGLDLHASYQVGLPIAFSEGLLLSNLTLISIILINNSVLKKHFKGDSMNYIYSYVKSQSGALTVFNRDKTPPFRQPNIESHVKRSLETASIGRLLKEKISLIWQSFQRFLNLFFDQFASKEHWVETLSRQRCELLTREINLIKVQISFFDNFINERSDLKECYLRNLEIALQNDHVSLNTPIPKDIEESKDVNVLNKSLFLGLTHTRQESLLSERIRLLGYSRELRLCFKKHVTCYFEQNPGVEATIPPKFLDEINSLREIKKDSPPT